MKVHRIVIVDDEKNFWNLLEGLLSEEGHEVETATNGAEALAAVEQAHPDLMLLDLHMPILDGFAVLEHLRRSGRTFPVVVVTARSDLTETALAQGAARVLTKPLDVNALLEAIRALV
jgi:CheY-like chemotaxis protein